jgi:alkylation response protein AidB-like acyl-CoA dehydrogenase
MEKGIYSYYFTEEHELFRQSFRTFLDKEVRPHLAEWEKAGKTPRYIWKKMATMGFLGLSYPEKYGGMELDYFYDVVFNEELGRLNSAGFAIGQQVCQYMTTPYILKFGSDFLKNKYIPGIIAGELVASIGLSEPNAGSDLQGIQTKAIRNGDHYIVNGGKIWNTNGVYGDFIITLVKTNPDIKGAKGMSLLIIDQNLEGVSRRKLNKLGMHSSDMAELHFNDVKVPVENLIGEEGRGFYYIMSGLQLERLTLVPFCVGNIEWALNTTLKYMSERKTFGKPINQYQILRHRMAQLATELEALKTICYHACRLYDDKVYDVKLCSMAKLIATELNKKVADQCLQIFGGAGFMEEYPLARMYRDAPGATIGGGTSDIMRDIIAGIVVDTIDYQKVK